MKTCFRGSRAVPILVVLFCLVNLKLPCYAGQERIVIGDVQLCKILGGMVLDQANSRIENVEVVEMTSDWKTVIRSTKTNADGQWSFPLESHKHIYFLRFRKEAFHEVQCRVKISKRKGKEFRIVLPVAT
jgi:hypothetical protein